MPSLPMPGEHAGEWGEILNDYLLAEHTRDGAHNTRALLNIPAEPGQVPVSDATTPKGVRWQTLRHVVPITVQSPTGPCEYIVWRAPAPARVVSVLACRQGGVGATITARKQGGGNHLAHDLSLSTVDSWLDGGAITSGTYAAGDTLVAVITNVAGAPHAITIQIEVTYE